MQLFRRRRSDSDPSPDEAVAPANRPLTGLAEPRLELDTSRLRPVIRSAWSVRSATLQAQREHPGSIPSDADRVAHRPMADGLVRALVWDTPTEQLPVTRGRLVSWNVDFDDLWPVAVANLSKQASTGPWACVAGKVWISLDEDDYAAERIFIEGHLETTGLAADVVLFHPNRTSLIVAPHDDSDALRIAAMLTEQRADAASPVSLVPIVGRDLEWSPLDLAPHHPAAAPVGRLRNLELTRLYHEQHELLRAIHDDHLVVAERNVTRQADGSDITWCTWLEGVESLLPRTDRIAFTSSTRDTFTVDWNAARTIVGHHMEATNHHPERMRVATFPTVEELFTLRTLANDG